ncbi:MAG: hypothetical protein JNM36_08545 [Chitinophagales bacterium]|jgi:hypothetical protein|nr:hypothetical protein [Chitinophagales bacterium]
MKAILVTICLCCSLLVNAQKNTYLQDNSTADSSFVVFKKQLQKAVDTQDTTALFAMLHFYIADSPDGCGLNGSKECFIETMGFRTTKKGAAFWREMGILLKLGFASNEYISAETGQKAYLFTAPYYQNQTTLANNELLILGSALDIYQQTNPYSKSLGKVSYKKYTFNKVITAKNQNPKLNNVRWVELNLGKGYKGYIQEQYTSLMIQRQLVCKKIAGEWKIVGYKKEANFYGREDF